MSTIPPMHEIAGRYFALYEGIYKEADPFQKGNIKAQAAASFLKRSNLSNAVLGQIWELSDRPPKGCLDKHGLFVALKLIACAQQGVEISLKNLNIDIPPPAISAQAQSPSLPAFGELSNISVEWAIKPKELEKYDDIFRTLGPVDGKLTGDQVKPVLMNSNLPTDILGKIWYLADIDRDGMLDRDEMCVALHLVYRALENDPVPQVLAPAMVPPSKRGAATLSRKLTLTGGVKVLPPQTSLTRRSRTSSVTSMESVGIIGGENQSPATGTRSLSGTPVPITAIKPPAPWIVDKFKWEQAFNEADTDSDGLVNGNDVKQTFIKTGLAQMYLAHIWNLCDINATGTLNLEQFALAMFFVEQKRLYNVEPPAELPPDLVPPSFRPNPAGMTDMATNTMQAESVELTSPPMKHKEIDQVMFEIQEIQKERRDFEHQIIQLEADTTIKQSEIRNLEVELATLEATLTQLEKQKREAQRRLDDLENQRVSFNASVKDIKQKNENDQNALNNLKAEAETVGFTMKAQEEELDTKQAAFQQLADQERQMESILKLEQDQLRNLNQEDRQVEEYIEKSNDIVNQLREQRHMLIEKLAQLEEILASGDVTSLDANSSLMLRNDDQNLDRVLGVKAVTSIPAQSLHRQSIPNDFDDPFKSHDPFIQHDPFASTDPFVSNVIDPFSSSDPFAGQQFGNFADPFANQQGAVTPSFGGESKKAPPPRPAPPPAKKQHDVVDPFAAPPSDGVGGGFANFADFAKFD